MRLVLASRVTALALGALVAGCGDDVSFAKDVMPILEQNCLSCHKEGGEGYAASGLSVESYEQIMKGTKFGAVIEPGHSYASTLQILVEHKADSSIAMPRGTARLDPDQIQIIGRWIDNGAKDN